MRLLKPLLPFILLAMKTPPLPSIPIYTIRHQRVVLDSDLAEIYGVSTGRFNEAVKRNLRRFPEGFCFILTKQEFAEMNTQLISQTAISSAPSPNHGGRRKLPRVFTEHGALMAASILSSDQAIAMSVYVIRAFVDMRERLLTNLEILKQLAQLDRTLLDHDLALQDIYEKLLPLLKPPPDPPRRRIGFKAD